MQLLRRIQDFLQRTGMSPTRFGREAMGDPRFVEDLARGRQPRRETEQRALAWLDLHETGTAR